MLKLLSALTVGLAASVALAQDAAVADKTPAAEHAAEKATETASAPARGRQKEEFEPPPGFTTKKRGQLVVYCKKDTTVGTRFKTESCYNEAQLREYLLAQEENKRNVDRIRNTCGGGSACASQ